MDYEYQDNKNRKHFSLKYWWALFYGHSQNHTFPQGRQAVPKTERNVKKKIVCDKQQHPHLCNPDQNKITVHAKDFELMKFPKLWKNYICSFLFASNSLLAGTQKNPLQNHIRHVSLINWVVSLSSQGQNNSLFTPLRIPLKSTEKETWSWNTS